MKKNLLRQFSLLSVMFFVFHFASCTDETLTPNPPMNENVTVELSSFPSIGSRETDFNFNVVLSDSSRIISSIKYDINPDNNNGFTRTTFDTLKTKLINLGSNFIIATVEFKDHSVLTCSTIVWLTEPKIISSNGYVYFEPNIYNGKMISVTHGRAHQIQFIDLVTFEMDCYFCGFEGNQFSEMHVSIPSFDGEKILFDNGINYKFCYYNLEKNDSTVTDIPMFVSYYPIGQITWSLDNKSIYYVSVDGLYSNIRSGIKSYNFESNETTKIFNTGDYISAVPYQYDKLAILEKVGEFESKLIIYNLISKSIENEYTDIPFFAPFRMLNDNDRIYFDGELAFYSLSKKKTYYMNFSEMELSQHMYGEADINMEGNKFIIGTWTDSRDLYLVELPDSFE